MKKVSYILSFVILAFASDLKAQDIHFSQALETPLFLSPANTGFFNGYFRASANYRNQWSAMNNAFQTYAVSIDGGLFKSRRRQAFMGIGMTVFSDVAGAAKLRKTSAQLNVSGLLKLSRRSALSVGLAGGAAGTNADYATLIYASQFDGNVFDPSKASGESVVYRQFTTTDIAAGAAYEFGKVVSDQDYDDVKSFRIAVGAYHLNRPAQEFAPGSSYRLPVRMCYSFISQLDVTDTKFTLTPTLIYQSQGPAQEFMTGTYLKYRTRSGTKTTGKLQQSSIALGMYYRGSRQSDALVPKLLFESGNFGIGLSYDVNISGYRKASRYMGGFEVALRYNALASSLFASKKEFR